GGGGGGAAGPNGNGARGGNAIHYAGNSSSGGGGAASGGSPGADALNTSPAASGGDASNGSGHGAGGTSASQSGAAGTPQSGYGGPGGGAAYYTTAVAHNAGPGAIGQEWDSTHGAGGGGGGAGGNSGNGADGGLYGGGGGGCGNSNGIAGSGAQGLIVITYTPSAGGTTISLDVVSAISFVSAITTTPRILTELNGSVANDTISSVELSATANGDTAARIGFLSGQRIDLIVPAATMTALNSDGASVIDFLENISSDKISPVEFGASVVGDKVFLEESGRGVRGEQLSPTQILGSVQKTDRAPLEWAGTVLVSLSADQVVPIDFTTSIKSDAVPLISYGSLLNGGISVREEFGTYVRSDIMSPEESGIGISITPRALIAIGASVKSDTIIPAE